MHPLIQRVLCNHLPLFFPSFCAHTIPQGIPGLSLHLDFITRAHESSLLARLLALPTLDISQSAASVVAQRANGASVAPPASALSAVNAAENAPKAPPALAWTRDFARRVLHCGFAFDYLHRYVTQAPTPGEMPDFIQPLVAAIAAEKGLLPAHVAPPNQVWIRDESIILHRQENIR